ncbi:methyltransferase domain-containing protein [Pseudomonas sp. xss_2]|uniref:methyltransferase domain-containing protein n=1 Tax=Pseudomonas sp. xss_2 TaxID=3367215 RepID=UPI00370C25C4
MSLTQSDTASEHERIIADRYLKAGDYIASESAYVRSLTFNSRNYKSLNNLGVLYETEGKLEKSLTLYKKACTIINSATMKRARYFENLVRACEKFGDKSLALWGYEKLLLEGTADYYTAVNYLELLRSSNTYSSSKQTLSTLEKLYDVKKVDPEAVADVYYKLIGSDNQLFMQFNSGRLSFECILEKYPLTLRVMSEHVISDPKVELYLTTIIQQLGIFKSTTRSNDKLHHISKLFNTQARLSGSIQLKPKYYDDALRDTCYSGTRTINAYKQSSIRDLVASPLSKNISSTSHHNSIHHKTLRQFYESAPYPKWENLPNHVTGTLEDYMSTIGELPKRKLSNRRILVAGCGTGRHAIQLALTYPDAQVVGIDISRSSLHYANEQKLKLSITNVKFFNCSIFEVKRLNLKFKIVECIGVLHHLKQPARALRSLLDTLDPDGVIKLGLYSKYARRLLDTLRERCTQHDVAFHPANLPEIRNLAISIYAKQLHPLVYAKDFYSREGCMDLLFNPYESPFTIRKIYELIKIHNLDFCGFECSRLPRNNPGFIKFCESNDLLSFLNKWHQYETHNPSTFSGMYLFWVKRRK